METSTAGKKLPWVLCAICSIGMVVFAGLYFTISTPKTVVTETRQVVTNTVWSTVTNTVSTTVTNEVIKEVPKEVEKIVKVPAEIPPEYINALNFYQTMTNAPTISENDRLFEMKDVQVVYKISDAIKQVTSEEEVKAKFELTLRRNNVPINPNSTHTLFVTISGFFDAANNALLCYDFDCRVYESQWIFRNNTVRFGTVSVWGKGSKYGTVGRTKADEAILGDTESYAEMFANDYLSANQK